MKKYLVCIKTKDGEFQRYETFANSRIEAENCVRTFCPNAVEVAAFDYMVQFE